jgi:hypothetical protein
MGQDSQKIELEQSFEKNQIEKLSKQNTEMAVIIANLHDTIKSMGVKFD